MSLKESFFFWFFLLWTLTLWSVMIYKLVSEPASYFTMLTNWNWTLNALFFGTNTMISAARYIFYSQKTRMRKPSVARYWLVFFFFWLTHGLAWLVFVLVWPVLKHNPEIIDDAVAEAGATKGEGLIADRVYHVLPGPFATFYIYGYWDTFKQIFRELAGDNDGDEEDDADMNCSPDVRSAIYAFCSTLSPVPVLVIYLLIFDMKKMYGIYDVPMVETAGLAALTLFVTGSLYALLYNDARKRQRK